MEQTRVLLFVQSHSFSFLSGASMRSETECRVEWHRQDSYPLVQRERARRRNQSKRGTAWAAVNDTETIPWDERVFAAVDFGQEWNLLFASHRVIGIRLSSVFASSVMFSMQINRLEATSPLQRDTEFDKVEKMKKDYKSCCINVRKPNLLLSVPKRSTQTRCAPHPENERENF